MRQSKLPCSPDLSREYVPRGRDVSPPDSREIVATLALDRPPNATHLLDAGADLAFVKDWLGHANIQNTTIYARLTTATLDAQARTIFASHRVV